MKLDIVITMAGLGSRFRKAGYNLPKYMIQAGGRSLFQWSIASLAGYMPIVDTIIFVVLRDRNYDVKQFIDTAMSEYSGVTYKVIVLDELTDGQATSAYIGALECNRKHGLLVHNIDTYIEEGCLNFQQLTEDGNIPCFKALGESWSFAKVDNSGIVQQVTEKQRISDYCSVGVYYFKTVGLYIDLYEREYKECVCATEKYIAPLYNSLIAEGMRIDITLIPSECVHVLGTPQELKKFMELLIL